MACIEDERAVMRLSALAQPHRLAAFRLLVAAEPEGMAAGDLARAVGIPPAGLSFHLTHLGHADLVTSTRDGRRIVYRANLDAMRGLLSYLTRDCCGGRPEICAGLADVVGSHGPSGSAGDGPVPERRG
ncbi:MAG: metalloregulator ArsR/SmtB family transcription factor [Alphaproteobacteria bacterium]|nr:metalloregulator ArsR/SmtB family transcription factor [Alphaproteobacteria bacterium]